LGGGITQRDSKVLAMSTLFSIKEGFLSKIYMCGFRVCGALFAAWRYCCCGGAEDQMGEESSVG